MAIFSPKTKRAAVRVKPPASQPIEIQIMGSGYLEVLRAKDVSISGIGILVPHAFDEYDPGAEVELVITLPNTRPFLARGVIRHNHKDSVNLFGIEFTSIEEKHLSQIRSFVDRCLDMLH